MKLIMAVFFVQSRPLTLLFPVYHFAVGTSQACICKLYGAVSDEFWKLTYTPTFTVRWPLVADGPEETLALVHFPTFYMSVLYTSRMPGRRQGLENSLAG